MNLVVFLGIFGAAMLAFANGANDISKSIATLVGSGESNYRKAVVLVSLAVACGAVMASAWGVKLTLLFTKGMLSPQTQINQSFALAVLAGSIGWVILATKFGMPVSTTHAIIGSVVLTGLYAFGFNQILWNSVVKKVFLPLLLSPVIAFGLTFLIFRFLFWLCKQKYCLNCHWAHWMSAVSSGFARGLNDTPKIAALGLVFYYLIAPGAQIAPRWFFLILAIANALGGITMGLKVTDTLAHKVTPLDHLEGFAANLATSVMVIATVIKGFPVSTTHVSGAAIIGTGLRKGLGSLNLKVVGEICMAWLITFPCAGFVGIIVYRVLEYMM